MAGFLLPANWKLKAETLPKESLGSAWWVWKPQSCRLQGPSLIVSIGPHPTLLKSTSSLLGRRPRHVVGRKARVLEMRRMGEFEEVGQSEMSHGLNGVKIVNLT